MKKTGAIVLFFLVHSIVFSQSLVELSRREKARRAQLKGKSIAVIQNSSFPSRKGGSLKTGPARTGEETDPKNPSANRDQGTPSQKRMIPKTVAPPEPTDIDQKETPNLQTLEEQLRKAKEYVELMTLKMNALWQEFYSMDDMKSRGEIQRQISETYQKLQKAQADEQKLQKDVDDRKK